MTETVSSFFSDLFNNNVVLATILIALVPLIELKGAIPFGTSVRFWGEYALSIWVSLLLSLIGCFIITVVLALVFKPIYNVIKDKKFFKSIIDFFTSSAKKKSEEISEDSKGMSDKKKLWIKLVSIFVFVAIPVPGTGVYTGTCLAIFAGLNFWQTVLSVTCGNVVAGLIITTICAIFPEFTTIIFYAFIIIMVVFLVYRIIVHFTKKAIEKRSTNKVEDSKENDEKEGGV